MVKYCGTGGGLGPLPSDPDNNLILSVTPAFGGIDISWTYPEINPQAVAYTTLYRSTNADPATKVRYKVVTGDFFYDRVNPEQNIEYFYWIQWVSINGTVGELIGPGSAIARPTIEQTIEMLTGQISRGQLGLSLQTEIDQIAAIERNLATEATNRLEADTSLGLDFTRSQEDVDNLAEYIGNEVQERINQDSEIIQNLNQAYTELNEERTLRVAAIQQEIADRKAAILSEANARQASVQNEINARIADVNAERDARVAAITAEQGARATAITSEETSRVAGDDALSTQITSLTSVVGGNTADISSEQTARANADFSLAQDITTLQVETGNNSAEIINESETRTSEYNSIALNQAVAAAAFQGNSATLGVLEQARASDKEAFASQLVTLSASIDDNEAFILEEKSVRSTALESITNELSVLSAKLDALPTFANDLEDGAEFSAWTKAAGETLNPEMDVAYSGAQSGLATSTATAPVLGGTPQVVAVALPSGTAGTLAGYKVRVTMAIKSPETGAATEIALAYQAGSQHSGWNYFTPTASWQVVEFTYTIPEAQTSGHYILLWADTSGAGLGVLVDRALVQVSEAEIAEISSAISEEKDARVAADEAIATDITSLNTQLDTTNASITTESTARANEDTALSQRITTMGAEVGANDAAITEEASLRVTAVNAVASDLSALSTTVDGNTSTISSESLARSNADTALGSRIDTIETSTDNNSAAITSESTARTTADSALGERIDLVVVDVGSNQSAIATEQTARANADGALAEDITTLTTATENNASSINQEASTRSSDDEAQGLLQSIIAASTKVSSGINRTREVVRVNDDLALSQRIEFLGSQFDENSAYIQTVETAMTTADSALASQMTTLFAEANENTATLLLDYETEVDAIASRVSLKEGIQTEFDENIATILTDYATITGAENSLASTRLSLEATIDNKQETYFTANPPADPNDGDLWVQKNNNNEMLAWDETIPDWVPAQDAGIAVGVGRNQVFRQTEPEPDAENVGDIWFNESKGDEPNVWDGSAWVPADLSTGEKTRANIQDNNRAMIGYCTVNGVIDSSQETPEACDLAGGEWLAAKPLAEAVKGVQITDGDGESANVEQRMVAYKDELGHLNSEYTVKLELDANGNPLTDSQGRPIAGGFGIAANTDTGVVEAGFNVDRFWVGKLNPDGTVEGGKLPFIIEGNEVFIDEAVIRKITLNQLMSDDNSLVFENGKLRADYIDVNNMAIGGTSTFSGALDVKSAPTGGRLTISGDRLEVYDGSNRLRVRVGRL